VLAEGYILGWYKNIQLALIIAAMVLVVYIAVWFFSIIVEKSTAKNINEALKSFNNDEE
jgi:ABC-type bacteriocin/lantibiotic exporter with double-glycine peptidase domain